MELKDVINQSGYYRIKVIPKQSTNCVREIMDDKTIKIAIKEPAEKGKANRELIRFIADELGIEVCDITISSGLTSRLKILSIDLSRKDKK